MAVPLIRKVIQNVVVLLTLIAEESLNTRTAQNGVVYHKPLQQVHKRLEKLWTLYFM